MKDQISIFGTTQYIKVNGVFQKVKTTHNSIAIFNLWASGKERKFALIGKNKRL